MFCFLPRSSVRFTFRDGHLPPFSSVGRGLSSASSTHDADILAQPNATLLKTNIRDKVFIIRLSLFRRTTPVPESTVNAENTNGRGPRAFSECSFFINYLSLLSLSCSDPAKLFSLPYPYSVFNITAPGLSQCLIIYSKVPPPRTPPCVSPQRSDTENYNRK